MTENQTTIQVLKLLAKQNKKKKSSKSKKNYAKTVYPRAIENKYKTKLTLIYKPLIDYVNKFLKEHKEELLRGDSSEMKLDAIPGRTYSNMTSSMQNWFDELFPENLEDANYIFPSLKGISENLKEFEDKEFAKQFEKAINVSIQEQSDWWNAMQTNWEQNNYKLIRSNASAFIDKINMLVENNVIKGSSPKELTEEIKKATSGLSDSKCRLIARDQIGKLQGLISQGQMQEIGLEMYIWSTSNDERVRDSHQEMEGLLCRWDDATVYSQDGGKTWIDRPSGAVELHPGQDIQCRCVALAYFPEIESVATGESMEIVEPEEIIQPDKISEIIETPKSEIEFNGEKLNNSDFSKTIVYNSKDFDNYVKNNKTEVIYRGYSGKSQNELDNQTKSMFNGTARISGEKLSASGRGLYFTNDRLEAEGYAKIRQSQNNQDFSNVVTSTLKKDSKIANQDILNDLYSKKHDEYVNMTKAIWEETDRKKMEILADKADDFNKMDIGTYAKSKGYDAIKTGFGEYVILNQDKLIYKL